IERQYTGYAIFIQSKATLDERSKDFRKKGERPRAWFWEVLFRYKSIYADVAMAAILINCLAIAQPLFVMNIYDRVVPNKAQETLWVLTVGVLIAFFFDWLLKLLRAYFIDLAGKRTDIILSSKIFEKIMNIKMEAKPRSAGTFASMVKDFESVRDFFTSATMTSIIDIPFTCLFIVIVFFLGGELALIIIISAVLIILINLLVQPA
ncbi:MAG: type I secretion system permease/ATPase, partial [Lentisphaeria bacterium]|nr:type I secretion system permease/ATPase [Lentisphaeria bacterium]